MNLPAPRHHGAVSTNRRDPRDDWPDEARALRDHLTAIYGKDDPFPMVAGAWCARQKSRHTRRAYARALLRWEDYARSAAVHPFQAKLPLADAYASYLETAPTYRRAQGGQRGETAPTGPPLSASGRAQALAACGSFYTYAVRVEAIGADPFASAQRPTVDPDYSPTEGLTDAERDALLTTAWHHNTRSCALVVTLYLTGARVDELLRLDADSISYDRGHYYIPLARKGGTRDRAALPPVALHAIRTHLDGRETGPLFTTRSGRRWSEPEVWAHLRVLARQAGIPQADRIKPHTLRHQFITDSLAAGIPLDRVQDAAGHADPRTTQRYNRRRRQLDDHPSYALAAGVAAHLDDEPDDSGGSGRDIAK